MPPTSHNSARSRVYRNGVAVIVVALVATSLLYWLGWPSLGQVAKAFPLVLVLAVVVQLLSVKLTRGENTLGRIARSDWAILVIALFGFGVAASLCLFGTVPQPRAHDEFSYLLAADTFAHGRLTNPTHPMWVHFETIHVLQQPSYASKYPPGQGIMLAIGELLGKPVIGVWISTALACAALFWMLSQWMPAGWALAGGILSALHPQMLEWAHTSWGGQVAVIGGALAVGAFKRVMDGPRFRDGLLAGIGLSIMANSRPFEGLILTIVLGVALLFHFRARPRSELRPVIKKFVPAAAAVLLLTAVAMGIYNRRVTGSVFTMPYMVYEAAYDPAPLFLWQAPRTVPAYNHFEIQDMFAGDFAYSYLKAQSLSGFLAVTKNRLLWYATWYFLAWPIFACLLVVIVWACWRDGSMRLVAWILGAFAVLLLGETFIYAHYVAPAAGLCLLLALMAFRHLRTWRPRHLRIGVLATRVLAILLLLLFGNVYRIALQVNTSDWFYQRANLMQQLTDHGGRHLILVHYVPGYDPPIEWVYNAADIDNSPVVWAHDMGNTKNQELLEYFKDRQVWLLTLVRRSASFAPYVPGHDQPAP